MKDITLKKDTIKLKLSNTEANNFLWRDRTGLMHYIDDMSTTHLFYTLRMVWNHSMPKEMHIGGNTQKYVFTNFYTSQYMMQACFYIILALNNRTDLLYKLQKEFQQMKDYFKTKIGNHYVITP